MSPTFQRPAMVADAKSETKSSSANSRVLEVNRPWLQKGIDAIGQCATPRERDWLARRLEYFVGTRRNDVSQLTEAEVLEYLDWQAQHGQKDWQILQSLSAICYMLDLGCQRAEFQYPAMREKWRASRSSAA